MTQRIQHVVGRDRFRGQQRLSLRLDRREIGGQKVILPVNFNPMTGKEKGHLVALFDLVHKICEGLVDLLATSVKQRRDRKAQAYEGLGNGARIVLRFFEICKVCLGVDTDGQRMPLLRQTRACPRA